MTIDIHGMNLSGPCRIIYMTAECLGLEYNMIECDLFKGENKTEEYLKLNIQHSIPTLVDGKTILNESRVAAAYLVNKYGKDDKLYPKDPETRAMVDQMLYFDMGVLYKSYGEVMVNIDFYKFEPISHVTFFPVSPNPRERKTRG